jgi:hypothetical protein
MIASGVICSDRTALDQWDPNLVYEGFPVVNNNNTIRFVIGSQLRAAQDIPRNKMTVIGQPAELANGKGGKYVRGRLSQLPPSTAAGISSPTLVGENYEL